jgi:hypothetical protein
MLEDSATLDKEPFTITPPRNFRSNEQVAHSFTDIPVIQGRGTQTPAPHNGTAIANATTGRPKALGYLRTDLSGVHATRHTAALHRHALTLGYQYVYTIHPPAHLDDPLAYALGIAADLTIDTLIIYDLAHVDDNPARACTTLDLETVCPPTTWARAVTTPATQCRTGAESDLETACSPGEYPMHTIEHAPSTAPSPDQLGEPTGNHLHPTHPT